VSLDGRTLVLALHLAAGMVAFLMAPLALATAKGGRSHRRWGKIFFWSMAAVAATALALVLGFGSSWSFLLIAVFTFYLALSGYRVLARKPLDASPAALDWIAAVAAAAGGAGLIGWAFFGSRWSGSRAAVPATFGVLSLGFAARELRTFLRPPTDKMHWWYAHMTRMMGAYIATISAFSSVNLLFLPPAVRWLWPIAVGVPAISITARRYRARFAPRATAAS
jgi:hypothetical protein